jgi:Protein of unknown function (DUF3618)
MGETTDQIERQIEQKRNELSENFNELERKVKSAVDWRTQFEEHPGTMLAIAFGGGAVLAAMFGGTRSSSKDSDSRTLRRTSDWSTEKAATGREYASSTGRDYTSSASSAVYKTSTTDAPRKLGHVRENLEALTGALLSVALSRATNLINTYLPGFEREFARMKASKASERTERGYSGTSERSDRGHSGSYSGGYSESPSERGWPNANAASTD